MSEKTFKYLDEWTELWRTIDTTYTRLMRHFNISGNTYCVLSLLLNRPEGVEPAEIADIVIIKRQMVALILNDLESRGWIVRKPQKTDHRRKSILLTKAGKKFAENLIKTSLEVSLHGLKVMTEEEQEHFFALSTRYCELIGQEVDRLTAPEPGPA